MHYCDPKQSSAPKWTHCVLTLLFSFYSHSDRRVCQWFSETDVERRPVHVSGHMQSHVTIHLMFVVLGRKSNKMHVDLIQYFLCKSSASIRSSVKPRIRVKTQKLEHTHLCTFRRIISFYLANKMPPMYEERFWCRLKDYRLDVFSTNVAQKLLFFILAD